MAFRYPRVIFHVFTFVTACALLSFTVPFPAWAQQTTAQSHNLSDVPFASQEKVTLRGEWGFHFGARLPAQEAAAAAGANQLDTIMVPLDWAMCLPDLEQNRYAHGYATYVTQLTLPYAADTPLTIVFPRVADAYEVFWVPRNTPENATKIGGSGTMSGPIRSSYISQSYPLDFRGDGHLVVHVRKEMQSYGGIIGAPFIASAEHFQNTLQRDRIIDGLVMGITFFAMMLNLFLFVVHRKDPATLLLALTAFAFLLRSVILAGMLEIQFGADIRAFRVRLEYVGILLIAWASFALHQTLLWRRFSDLSAPLVAGVIAMLGSAILFTAPLSLVTDNLIYVQLYCVAIFGLIMATSIRAISKRKQDAWFYTLGWFVPLLAGVNDIVVSQSYKGVYVINYAFLLFLCVYSLKVGRRVTRTISRADLLDQERATLQQLHRDAKDTASRDHLTGLLNRQAFDNELTLAWREKDYSIQGISLVIFDIDHFKLVNDTYGHPAGDDVLRAVADLVQAANLRRADRVCRFGGEEFVMILPDTSCENAKIVAERMRNRIATMTTECTGNVSLRVTASFGIACGGPNTDLEKGELLLRADEALDHAKSSGRNRSVTYAQMIEENADPNATDLQEAG
ncbi:GGDEF domain-containing protein [Shimia sagamensis]|uniref:diguanylate cyclase n=1 Tax=Shimia sagamensis TaxID=1566352 RepID=A0ABY1NJB6_9RHOB|nr:diguanylate cyclase [Shimia sagamensis]SMP10955.1 diguanylate cyclase (GGDEF) domain-containing protein [Shimia sagamensis]